MKVFKLLYKTLVTPILEYAVPMWSPYLVKGGHLSLGGHLI